MCSLFVLCLFILFVYLVHWHARNLFSPACRGNPLGIFLPKQTDLYFLTLTEKSANTRKYCYSTSPGSLQGIVFSTKNGAVMVFELVHPGEQEIG